MKSKTLIEKQLKKKTNPVVVETIILAKKNKNWLEVASLLSYPKKKQKNINLSEISKIAKEGETIVIPGKVLSEGELDKKIKIIAFDFSEKAKEKIIKSGSKCDNILSEIKSNKDAKGVRIIK